MKSTVLALSALAALVAASPAPQMMDLSAILAAPAPSITGPAAGVSNETVAVNTASIIASVSARVTSMATASVNGTAAAALASNGPDATGNVNQKRGLLEGLFRRKDDSESESTATTATTSSMTVSKTSSTARATTTSIATSTSTSSSMKSGSSSQTTTSSSSSVAATTSSSSVAVTTTSSSYTIQGSSSTTSSSSTACPTTPEAGTYCGFINPEDPCAPQPDGYGPVATPDTVAAFLAYPAFHTDARKAPTPPGYTNVFRDLNASVSAASYLGLYTLRSYDAAACAAHCDTTALCTAFNIYIERDPSLNPTANASSPATYCPNPASITNYKCTLWGAALAAAEATNTGGWREQFQVAVVASNAYDKTPTAVPALCAGWDAPKNCSGRAVDAGAFFMGANFFPGPFDPALCAGYAALQTASNRKLAGLWSWYSYTPCNMFNAYYVRRNGKAVGTYCALYDTPLGGKWATYAGSQSGGDRFDVESSWTYALSVQDSGKL
ncbi:hypothetical protein LTR28_006121 [Elasticomyces elasticus]|nr:hypothetical protein LTR28_006121 [Elasticomyces elasticus]